MYDTLIVLGFIKTLELWSWFAENVSIIIVVK